MMTVIPAPEAQSIAADDDSDIGIRRQFRAMKARLQELETLYASRFKHQVPTATSIKAKPIKQCRLHLHVVVHDHAAIVECADCHAPLDPLHVLREFAHEERHFADQLEHLRQEKANLRKEIEALKKQKAALRSGVRRAGGTPIEPWQIKEDG